MAELRTFDVPRIPDDVTQVTDGEQILWKRRGPRHWETVEEQYPEIRTERDLIIEYGPLTEAADGGAVSQ